MRGVNVELRVQTCRGKAASVMPVLSQPDSTSSSNKRKLPLFPAWRSFMQF